MVYRDRIDRKYQENAEKIRKETPRTFQKHGETLTKYEARQSIYIRDNPST